MKSLSYVIGLGFALLLTGVSFWVASTSVLWGPGVAVGLVVLAIAQMGVHLVFFLHITSGPDNTNNVLALAFGVLIVFLVMIGTIWIMTHMDANMAPRPGAHEPADAALRACGGSPCSAVPRTACARRWCRMQDSNPRPSVYKTAALPTELIRPVASQCFR